MTKAKTPDVHSRLAKYFEKRVLGRRPHKTQAKIAEEAGLINPNMIAMLKAGATTLQLNRVANLAAALGWATASVAAAATGRQVSRPPSPRVLNHPRGTRRNRTAHW